MKPTASSERVQYFAFRLPPESATLTRADKVKLRAATIFHRRRVELYLPTYRDPVPISRAIEQLITLRGWRTA